MVNKIAEYAGYFNRLKSRNEFFATKVLRTRKIKEMRAQRRKGRFFSKNAEALQSRICMSKIVIGKIAQAK